MKQTWYIYIVLKRAEVVLHSSSQVRQSRGALSSDILK